jgi:hypothetical protein
MRESRRSGLSGLFSGFGIAGLALVLTVLMPHKVQAQAAVTPPGDGSAETPYLISLPGHLVWMSESVGSSSGKRYELQNDIDASDTTNWNAGAGFIPIGHNDAGFMGVFDGNGNVISNLTIIRPSENEVGLFGFLENGVVTDLTLAGGAVTGDGYVGSLVGWNNRGLVSQCSAMVPVTGYTFAGGLVGINNAGTVTVSSASGPVKGFNLVGGLVGENSGPLIGCFAGGTVTGGDRAGGLVGANYDTVSGSHATGAVSGVAYIGGLMGRSTVAAVSGSSATGPVYGNGSVGGLVGYLSGGTLDNCQASGTVTVVGTWAGGGLVGYSTGCSMSRCHAAGAVTGKGGLGGLVGECNGGFVTMCYTAGDVTGTEYVGGLIGYNSGNPVGNCYAMGDVTGISDNVGGLVGFNNYTTVARCYAAGFVTGSTWAGGLVGGNNSTVLYSYWDTNTSGREYSGGGTGKSTEEMKMQATFSGWDFTNVWRITENESYPVFAPPPEPRIGLSGNLAFGNVETGQTATATLTITNDGNAVLTVSGITYPSGFSGEWSGSIEAGGATNVTVTFSPEAVQAYGGTVTVNSDKTGGQETIDVSGTGVPVPQPGQVCFSASTYTALEGVKAKAFVRRINGTNGMVSVNYVMKNLAAIAGQDYLAASGTLTWQDGESGTKTIKITIRADGKVEGSEAFQIVLKNPVGAALAAPSKAKVTIQANRK